MAMEMRGWHPSYLLAVAEYDRRKAAQAKQRRSPPRKWRGPTRERYPESFANLDLDAPDESFEAILDQIDEMPPTLANRVLGSAYDEAWDAYGVESREAALGDEERRRHGGESVRGAVGANRVIQLLAGHMLRADKYNVESTLTVEEWLAIRLAHDWTCVYCGTRTRQVTIDHYVPMSRGGANTAENVVPACSRCNSSKWAKDPVEWMRSKGVDPAVVSERIEVARARREAA